MHIFLVGGCVRDTLLGLSVQDYDYVVVGSTPEEMIALGFLPVGKDFPVFLHPHTHAEYALARTERKVAPGYHGFTFHANRSVTIEEDLARRDLTINAMAIPISLMGEEKVCDIQKIIDPFHGRADLAHKILRHVSEAFTEDPVRILRTARFAARLPDFTIAQETHILMKRMVHMGEIGALVPERVWQEVSRSLMEQRPSRFFSILRTVGALEDLFPEIAPMLQEDSFFFNLAEVLDSAAQKNYALAIRCAIWISGSLIAAQTSHEALRAAQRFVERLKVPRDIASIISQVMQLGKMVSLPVGLTAEQVVSLLLRADALRRPERFLVIVQAALCVHKKDDSNTFFFWKEALARLQAVPSGIIAAKIQQDFPHQPDKIVAAILSARVSTIEDWLSTVKRT